MIRPRIRPPVGFIALTAAVVTCALGCGKPGSPRPPEPRGPMPPRAVDVRQLGDAAEVGFTVPQPRGSRPSQQPEVAELLRVVYRQASEPPADPDAFRRRGELVATLRAAPLDPGQRRWLRDDTLSALPDGGVGAVLRYGLRVRDRRGRPSPLVLAVDLRVATPVPPPDRVSAEPTADGIRLAWSAGAADRTVALYRRLSGEPWPERPIALRPMADGEYLDTTARTGETYEYAARVVLEPGSPPRESAGSPPTVVVAEDRFAPSPPTGLTAVQEGGAVRLFWNPSPERDLAGYLVERRIGDGPWTAIGPRPIEQPLYLDGEPRPGDVVTYRVRAVDRAEPPNVSEPSREVAREIVVDPAAGGETP